MKIRAINALQVRGANFRRLQEWFDIAKENLYDIPIKNIYNMDETGIMLGHLHATKRVVTRNNSFSHRKNFSTQESATVIECISANGQVIKPPVILKAKTY